MTLENKHKAVRQLDWQADSLRWVLAAAPAFNALANYIVWLKGCGTSVIDLPYRATQIFYVYDVKQGAV
jgi:hypothetical protein